MGLLSYIKKQFRTVYFKKNPDREWTRLLRFLWNGFETCCVQLPDGVVQSILWIDLT